MKALTEYITEKQVFPKSLINYINKFLKEMKDNRGMIGDYKVNQLQHSIRIEVEGHNQHLEDAKNYNEFPYANVLFIAITEMKYPHDEFEYVEVHRTGSKHIDLPPQTTRIKSIDEIKKCFDDSMYEIMDSDWINN